MNKYKGDLGLLMVAIIWGSGFIGVDFALKYFIPTQIIFLRFLIAGSIMLLLSIPKLKNVDKELIKSAMILSFFLYIPFYLQTTGLLYTTLSKSAFLTATNVVIVPFIALVIYKRKVDKHSILGAFVTLAGIAILSLGDNFSLGYGEFITFLSAIGFAVQIFLTGEITKKHDFFLVNAFIMLFTAMIGFGVLLATQQVSTILSPMGDMNAILSIAFVGIFPTSLAYLLQIWSQQYTTPTKAAVILSTEAIFGTLMSVMLLSEELTLKIILGCVIISLGVLISEVKPSFRKLVKATEHN